MRPRSLVLLALALLLGGCAAPDESLQTTPFEAPTTYATSSSTSTATVTTVTSTSSTIATTTMAPTTTSTVPVFPIVLRGDGLGVVSFGEPVEHVMIVLTDLFGPPSDDQLYESPFTWEGFEGYTGPRRGVDACHMATVGDVCFDYIRHVSWGNVGLWVTFSDLMVNENAHPGGDDYWLQVPPNLRGYHYRAGDTGPTASAVHGITVGSTVKDLQALGDEVTFGYDACGDVVVFSINYPDSTSDGRINGYLLGTDSEAFSESGYVNPDATVSSLSAGTQSSC